MTNQPANAGSGRGQPPQGNPVPPLGAAARPLNAAAPRAVTAPRAATAPRTGHRATRPRDATRARDIARANEAARPRAGEPTGLAWVAYLIALAGVAVGVFMVCLGSRYTGRGAGLMGCSLLGAGLARLVLPPHLAGLLASRRRTSDVLAFAAFGAGVLVVALMLP